jgi:uncharacterized protein (TIGR02611 family)
MSSFLLARQPDKIKLMLLKYARRVVVAIVGTTVLLFGIALTVLPGPAFIVIPVGLAILATEFAWAQRWLKIVREAAEKGVDKLSAFPWAHRLIQNLREAAVKIGDKLKIGRFSSNL